MSNGGSVCGDVCVCVCVCVCVVSVRCVDRPRKVGGEG